MKNSAHSKSIDEKEIEKFSAMADDWWNEEGKFKPLHKFNPIRISYLRDNIIDHFSKKESDTKPLSDLKILDIGCGGGLLCEPMKKLGADVTGIDASEKNIKIASAHAQKMDLDINYQNTSAEDLAASGKQFDIVLNMEVIEHVADVESFMASSCNLLKPGGMMFIATLNRTIKSFAFAIIGAEYVLRWLPKGTHSWEKFLKPSEVQTHLFKNSLEIKEITGVKFNPFTDSWSLDKDLSINYIMVAVKK